jgi:hypothetical protein
VSSWRRFHEEAALNNHLAMYAGAYSRTVHDHFGVHATEARSYVAVPTNWEMGRQNAGHFFRCDLAPLDGLAFGTEQRGFGIQPVDLSELLSARYAVFVCVPANQHIPEQTVLRRKPDLKQALLPAVLALWPSRAGLQTKVWMADRSSQGDVSGVHFNRRRLPCFRTANDPLASVPDKSPGGEWNHKIQSGED